MRKISLKIDDLTVESFSTAGGEGRKQGTVRGHDWSEWEECTQMDGCNSGESLCATCDEGCPADTQTCFASCRMTNGYQVCIDPYC
ncbi:MAG TPA: hypothetical protein VK358_08950 [Longimicrobium sp.]|nr:hypothetical protein [Longimicrobium sp.]